ncbi:MAG: cyanophycin synthetase [Candidatus Liptonbacteria bacterium]|nr:cyanophycin synthetase [Candidatus Liptonbacteria bacterium]
MQRKKSSPLLGKVLKKIAPKIGARVILEPRWNIVGQIIFKRGRKRYFRYSSLDLNPLGASEISNDKDYANFFMKRLGYPTVPGEAFFSPQWAEAIGSRRTFQAAYRYARKLGFPVVVKPNSGSQGRGVTLVYNKKEFYSALREIFLRDRVVLVQKPVLGNDYRVVVLNDKVISAYQRIPLNVIGDGVCTIRQLLLVKQRSFEASSRDTQLKLNDQRISKKLARQRLFMRSIPAKGRQVFLLDNANLSTGGDSIDVTREIHPDFKKIAVALTKDMGLRLCGVDLMVRGDIRQLPATYWILEINAAPGLDHYAKSGKAQEKIVEDLYLQVLKSME